MLFIIGRSKKKNTSVIFFIDCDFQISKKHQKLNQYKNLPTNFNMSNDTDDEYRFDMIVP